VIEILWEHKLTQRTDLNALYSVQFSQEASGQIKFHSIVDMDLELTGSLDLNISAIWDYTKNHNWVRVVFYPNKTTYV